MTYVKLESRQGNNHMSRYVAHTYIYIKTCYNEPKRNQGNISATESCTENHFVYNGNNGHGAVEIPLFASHGQFF